MATAEEMEDAPVQEACEVETKSNANDEKPAPTIPAELLSKFVGVIPNLHKIDARCVSDHGGDDKFRINVWTKGKDHTRVVQEYNIVASYFVSYNSKSKAKVRKIVDLTIINPILPQGAELAKATVSSDASKSTRTPGVAKQAASAS